MCLHIPTNFLADLHVLSYWTSQKGIKGLHILSHSCREGTRAQQSLGGLLLWEHSYTSTKLLGCTFQLSPRQIFPLGHPS